jgi:hypothetical protein
MEKELSKSVARDEDNLERLESISMNAVIDKLEEINKVAKEMHGVDFERLNNYNY